MIGNCGIFGPAANAAYYSIETRRRAVAMREILRVSAVNVAAEIDCDPSQGDHDKIVLKLPGQALLGSPASMEKRGALNPAHLRWLMGFPPEWDDCAAMVTPLSRKSRQRS
jgi:hypothetical protein